MTKAEPDMIKLLGRTLEPLPRLDAKRADLLRRLLVAKGIKVAENDRLPPAVRTGSLPLSFAQQRLWFLDQLAPGTAYNVPACASIDGRLDVGALRRSLDAIVARHEALRTHVDVVDGVPMQVIAPQMLVGLELVDLARLPAARRQPEVQRLAAEEAGQAFDLARGPLLRAKLLRLRARRHVLLLCLHHIVSDGWSMGVLFKELASFYESFTRGLPSSLPELPIQYADFAIWQREWLQGAVLESQLGYWKRQLEGYSGILDLPTDRSRPPVQSYRGAAEEFRLSASLTEALRRFSRQEGVTVFMTLLAAFQLLLARYSGQSDLAVGTPIANRNRPELEGLIGFFANTLVLRSDLSGNPSFRELVRRVRETTLAGYEHQDLPFERLVEELQPARDLSRSPLFQVLFVDQNVGSPPTSFGNLKLAPWPLDVQTSKFDLSITVVEEERSISGRLEYNSDLFEAGTVRRMIRQLLNLLLAATADADCRILNLSLLSPAEREVILSEWNATAHDLRKVCVHTLFEEQSLRTPKAVAVRFGGSSLTYGALDQKAAQLANHLLSLGVGAEAVIGVFMERSLELPVALLGVLKAGAAYLPLDVDYPRDRLAFMIQDAGARVLLTQNRLRRRLPKDAAVVVSVEDLSGQNATGLTAHPRAPADLDSLAYVMYTSGSTGRPKGVTITHRGLTNRLQWMQRAFPIDASDSVVQKTPYTFDVSVWEFFWPLIIGGKLVMSEPGSHLQPQQLTSLLRREKVTTIHFVPSLLRMFIDSRRLPTVTSLKRVFVSGEALSNELANHFGSLSSAELVNLYGPTEASIDVTFHRCSAASVRTPIGKPISNTSIYIVDAEGQPAPVGISGEIYIGGVGLARGYLGQPALTGERFVPDWLSGRPGMRLYRSGDRGRFLPDGAIEFLGRLDNQVKIHGNRIEPGEIESAIADHDLVRAAVVRAVEDGAGDKRLIAYVVADGKRLAPDQLREWLASRLPPYFVPELYVFLEKLPLTPSGKVDLRSLPDPGNGRSAGESSYAAPRTPTERRLARIWEDILAVPQVGITDNFFALGGDSIRVIQVVTRCREIDLDFSVEQIYRYQTIAMLMTSDRHSKGQEQQPSAVRPFSLVPSEVAARLTHLKLEGKR